MKLLFPFIIFDLAFLPLFHIAGLPVKPSYLLVILLFVSPGSTIITLGGRLGRDLLALFFVLSILTIIGSLVFMLAYDGASYSQTVRNIIIFVLAPMAFIVGTRDSRRWHSYVVIYILAYAAITLVFSAYYLELGWLATFYGLEERVASGVYASRSQGLFWNANVSALFMTMLFLYFAAGVKYGFVRTMPIITFMMVSAAFATVAVLGSRNQFLALGIISLLLIRSMWIRGKSRGVAVSVLVSVIALVLFSAQLGNLANQYVGYDPVAALERGFSTIGDTEDSSGSFLRPIRSLGEALERWGASPLVGTGFDSTGTRPFQGTQYHNDWLLILTASGAIGLLVFAAIVYRLARLDLILLVPFLLPGMTNSFIFAPSHFLLFMLLAGMLWRRKAAGLVPVSEESVVRRNLPAFGQGAHTR